MQLLTEESEFLRDLVLRESSIVLGSDKEYLLTTRLAPVLRAQQIDSIADLVRQLKRDPRGRLRADVVEAMTTNETSFFRDHNPWELLRKQLLPDLIAARQSSRELTITCAACSSGQEPYSLAMLLTEHFPDVASNWRVRIIGTDLSPKMVERTKEGKFSQLEVGRGLPSTMLPKYFKRVGMSWHARDDLRKMIDAKVANLAERSTWSALPQLDLVMLRNVLIYFSTETKQEILRSAHSRLRPTGFLMLGASETTVGLQHDFVREQADKATFFRPTGAPVAAVGTAAGLESTARSALHR